MLVKLQLQVKVNNFTYEGSSSDLDAEHAFIAETHEGDKEQAEEDEERGTSGKQFPSLGLFWTTIRLRIVSTNFDKGQGKLLPLIDGSNTRQLWSQLRDRDNDKKNSLFGHSSLKSIEMSC